MKQPRPVSLTLLRRRVAIDLREEALYWAESSWGAKGLRLRRWGRIERGEGEVPDQLVQRVAGTGLVRGAEVAVPIHHPELRIRRLDLPPLSAREAKNVVSRRAREIGEEIGEGASCGFVRSRGKGARAAWLLACPPPLPELEEERWQSLGIPIHRLGSRHLALGNLARALAPPDAGELVAIFDLSADQGTCVLIDAQGWGFARDVPVKLAGTQFLRSVPGDDSELDPLEQSLDQAARFANELGRTFHYAETELRLGRVRRLVLSGESEDLLAYRSLLADDFGFEVLLLGDAIPEGPAAGAHPAAAVALGLALSSDERGENLLPLPSRRRLDKQRAGRRLITGAVLAVVLALGTGAYLGSTVSSLRREIVSLDAAWEAKAAARKRAEVVASSRARAARIEHAVGSIWQPTPSWTGAIKALGLSLPEDALVERLVIDHQETRWRATLHVEFRGEDVAEAADSVSQFTMKLGQSPLWVVRSVDREHLAPASSETTTGSRMRFRIDAEVAPTLPTISADAETEPSSVGDSHG